MGQQTIGTDDIRNYVAEVIGNDDHARRVFSIANGVAGLVHGAAFSVHAIGAALAQSANLSPKHATKQVDRLLSNPRFDVMARCAEWICYVIGQRKEILVALDWTDYDADNQATLSLALVEKHGRATPLLWRTVLKSELKDQRNRFEDELLVRFHERVPPGVRVTVTADRGFADQKLFSFLHTLGFDYVIRIRKTTVIHNSKFEGRVASRWLHSQGRLHCMRNPTITNDHTPVATFVSVRKKRMKQAWFLVSSRADWSGTQIVAAYGKRFTIEEMFRDEKDPRFGMGLSQTRIRRPDRRDRMLFLGALARDLLTLLGAACESLGMDRLLKVNTVKTRTHSLYRQGCYYYGALPNMKEPALSTLMNRFGEMIAESRFHLATFGTPSISRG